MSKIKRFCRRAIDLEIGFKIKRLEKELERADPRLRAILFELAFFVKNHFDKKLLITHIERTQKEQNLLYKERIAQGFFVWIDGKKFYSEDKKKLTLSPHQSKPTRAVDLRSKDFKDEEILMMKKHIDFWFPYGGGKSKIKRPTFLCHKNSGEHIHLQVPGVVGGR